MFVSRLVPLALLLYFRDEPSCIIWVNGLNAWSCITDLWGNQRKILPVVGTRRETYNIWGVYRWRRMRLSHLSPDRFIEGLNGDQFLGEEKLNVFFNHSQILDLCGPKRLEVRHHLFDQDLGR